MISVSAITPMGEAPSIETDPLSDLIEALLDAMPSWAAEVGMLINGMLRSLATTLAISILLPPPMANMNVEPYSWILSLAFSMFSLVALSVMKVSMSYP